MNIQPIKFACDSLPNCQGQIVDSIGNFVIIEGLAQDSGAWFAKGIGGARRFGTRQEAADYIEYAMDAKDGGPGSGPSEGSGLTGPHAHERNKQHYRGLQLALTKAALRGDRAEVSEIKQEMQRMLPEIKRQESSFR